MGVAGGREVMIMDSSNGWKSRIIQDTQCPLSHLPLYPTSMAYYTCSAVD